MAWFLNYEMGERLGEGANLGQLRTEQGLG